MSLTLLMASLYAVDVSVLETCEDSDEILQRLPMTSDVDYMKQVRPQNLFVMGLVCSRIDSIRICLFDISYLVSHPEYLIYLQIPTHNPLLGRQLLSSLVPTFFLMKKSRPIVYAITDSNVREIFPSLT